MKQNWNRHKISLVWCRLICSVIALVSLINYLPPVPHQNETRNQLQSVPFIFNEILRLLLVSAPWLSERVRFFWPQFFFLFPLLFYSPFSSRVAYITQRINLSKLFSFQPPPPQPIKLWKRHLLYWSFLSQWINNRSKQSSPPTFLISLCFSFISSSSDSPFAIFEYCKE